MACRILICLICLARVIPGFSAIASDSISGGIVSISKVELDQKSVELSGYWEFYPNELMSSNQMDGLPTKSFTKMPGWWEDQGGKPSVQVASYRLKIILPAELRSADLALSMPDVYSSYDLWANGKLLGSNGKVGNSKEGSRPQWKPETYSFKPGRDTIEIILHISNFYHNRTGLSRSILLGKANHLIEVRESIEFTDTLLLIAIGCLSIVGAFYFVRLKKISLLFYVFLCFSWMIRAAFSNHYQIVQWFPDINWYLCVKAEYVSIYLSTLFGSLMVRSVFPSDTHKGFGIFFIVTCSVFTLFTLVAPPKLFTAYVQLYLGLSSLLLLSIFVIVIKAYISGRRRSEFVLITALLGVGMFGYVILSYQGFFELNDLFFNGAFIIEFILILIAILRRIDKIGTDRDHGKMMFDQYVNK